MALFRDRRGFPRWSFIDSRSLPRPRHAKDDKAFDQEPTSPASAPPAPMDPAKPPVVRIHAALDDFLSRDPSAVVTPEPVAAAATLKAPVSWESPVEESGVSLRSADSPESAEQAPRRPPRRSRPSGRP